MTTVECGCITCKWNDKSRGKYGLCQLAAVTLKWRFAADMGKGTVVCVEYMQLELPDGMGGG